MKRYPVEQNDFFIGIVSKNLIAFRQQLEEPETMPQFFRLILSVCFLSAFAFIAHSAQWTKQANAEMGCLFSLSGTIELGDRDKMLDFLQTLGPEPMSVIGTSEAPRYMCLDSSGGNLSETLKIVDLMLMTDYTLESAGYPFWLRNLGTAIAPGATCSGSCALIFFAGQESEGDFGRYPDRTLHAAGFLSIHAEDRKFTKETYSRSEMEREYSNLVKAVTAFRDLSDQIGIPLNLLLNSLITPSRSPRLMATPADFVNLQIKIYGLPVSKYQNKSLAQMYCFGSLASIDQHVTHDRNSVVGFHPRHILWSETANFTKFERTEDGVIFEIKPDDEGEDFCEGMISSDGSGYFTTNGGTPTRIFPWMGYPLHLTFNHLHKAIGGMSDVPPKTSLSDRFGKTTSQCFIVNEGQIVQTFNCKIKAQSTLTADLNETFSTMITWSDGHASIGISDRQLTYNGRPASLSYNTPDTLSGENDVCIDDGSDIQFCCKRPASTFRGYNSRASAHLAC